VPRALRNVSVEFRMPTLAAAQTLHACPAAEPGAGVVPPVPAGPRVPSKPRPTDAANSGQLHVFSRISNVQVVSIAVRESGRIRDVVSLGARAESDRPALQVIPLTTGHAVRGA